MNTQRTSNKGFFTRFCRWLAIPLLALLAFPLMLSPVSAQTFQVTNTNDWGPGSLRKMIKFANRNPGPDIITFGNVTGTIVLDAGTLLITEAVDIQGPGSDQLIIDAGGVGADGPSYVIIVEAGLKGNYRLSGMTIQNGRKAVIFNRYYALAEGEVQDGPVTSSLVLNDLRIINNIERGIEVDSAPYSADANPIENRFNVRVNDSEFIGNDFWGLSVFQSGFNDSDVVDVKVTNSYFTGHDWYGAVFGGNEYNSQGSMVLTIEDSTFTQNKSGLWTGGSMVSTLKRIEVSDNYLFGIESAAVFGGDSGPVIQQGTMRVIDSQIVNNGNTGIFAVGGGYLYLEDSEVSGTGGNGISVGVSGGDGFYQFDHAVISNSTISGNAAAGIQMLIQWTEHWATWEEYQAWWTEYGQPDDSYIVDVRHSTVTDNGLRGIEAHYNICADAGCHYPYYLLNVENSIVADNRAPDWPTDIAAVYDEYHEGGPIVPLRTDIAYSLIGELDRDRMDVIEVPAGSNIFDQSAQLRPLANNGGSTFTHLPRSDSPVIDAGDPLFSGPPTNDQRGDGFPRVQGSAIDMGAVETTGSSLPPPPSDPACGKPTFDKATESGFFLWNDCGTNLWNIRVTAGGQSLSYLGSLTSDAGFSLMEAFSYEGNDAMPPDFAMHVGNAGQDGLRFGLPEGAQGCVTVNGPAGMSVTAGANRVNVGQSVSLPDFGECGSTPPPPPPPTDDPTCGMPSFDKATESGFFLWNECGTNVWNARVTAGGQSLSYLGSLTSDAGFSLMEAFSYEGNDAMPPNFAMHVGNAGQDGLRFGLPDGAQGCVTVNGPAGMSITAGANRVDVGQSVSLPDFGECGSSPPPPPPPTDEPTCGMPSFDKATESGFFLWNECGSNVWHARVTAGGQSLSYVGSLTSSPGFTVMEAFSFEGNDVMPPDFAMHVGNAGQDGLRFIPPQGAAVCLTLDGPADMVITAGSDRVNVGRSVSLPDYGSCSN